MVASFKIRFLVGILTISVLLMVFCLPINAYEFVNQQELPSINSDVYRLPKYSYWTSRMYVGTKNSQTTINIAPNVAQKEWQYGAYMPTANGNFYTFPDSGGNYAKYFSIDREYIYLEDNPYKYYDVLEDDAQGPENVIEDFYLNVTTRFVMPREQLKRLPTIGLKPNVTVRTTSADETIDFSLPSSASTVRIQTYFMNESEYSLEQYGDLVVIDIYTSTFFDISNYLYVTAAGEQDIYIERVYIDYRDELVFGVWDNQVTGAITYKTFIISPGNFSTESPSQAGENMGNIGDIFVQNQTNTQIDINDAISDLDTTILDNMASSEHYIFWATFFGKIWAWDYATIMVLTVLTFALISFIAFGKRR